MQTPDQNARRSSWIWNSYVCERRFKNISADDESKQPAVIGAFKVNKWMFNEYTATIEFHKMRGSDN